MYLKRVDGPRQVTLPDGSILSRADLPDPMTRRWVASRKAAVVKAVIYGLITEAEARERYALSEEEFALWRNRAESDTDSKKKTALSCFLVASWQNSPVLTNPPQC